MISDWQVAIARADLADWVTAAAYGFAAPLCVRASGHARRTRHGSEGAFWSASAVLLVLLAINELLDLQNLVTEAGRAHAKANGWYGERRQVQYLFVVALGVAAVFVGATTLWLTRRAHAAVRLALFGFVFIGLFVLIRAASFHHVGELLNKGGPEFTWASLQEITGILIVAAAAALYTRTRPRNAGRK
jgi:hypothetical protein